MKKDSDDFTYEVILHMLTIALVEIRATDNILVAQKLADIFHNVPGRISKKFPPSDIYSHMLGIAKINDMELYIENLKSHSIKNIASNQ